MASHFSLFAFSYCSWGSHGRNIEVVCPFPSAVYHILSELSTTTCLGFPLHGVAHSFLELDKAVVHVIRLVSFL